jgi:hypothetical protein
MTTMRDKAVALATLNLRVFPLKPKGKTPIVKAFYDVASCDPIKVAAMWTGPDGESTEHNIGISTDGILVLDVDAKHGKNGFATLAQLVRDLGLDLNTVSAMTPSGGHHYYFVLPPGTDPASVPNSSEKVGPGIDTRSYHGFVVAPGSVTDKGEYRWIRPPSSHGLGAIQ